MSHDLFLKPNFKQDGASTRHDASGIWNNQHIQEIFSRYIIFAQKNNLFLK